MKGIILAGGSGSRLRPSTLGTSKQLLNVYDKPAIYYPLSTMMLAGIQDILVITSPEDLSNVRRLLKDGSDFGVRISYEVQSKPNGIAEAFIIGEKFIGKDSVCLLLGDNVIHGAHLIRNLRDTRTSIEIEEGAYVFLFEVPNPERYGVAYVADKEVIKLEEKPKNPKSNFAVIGLYMLDNTCIEKAKSLTKSKRGELEIVDVLNGYLKTGSLSANFLGDGFTWFDVGTVKSLNDTANYVKLVQENQGRLIGSPEAVAYELELIDKKQLKARIEQLKGSPYAEYLDKLLEDK